MPEEPIVVTIKLSECDRQLVLLALAKLSLERPGWEWTLKRLALTMGDPATGPEPKATLFEQFRQLHISADKGYPGTLVALDVALVESVRLQSHYARLLNMWDGGERMQFESASAWVERLKKIGTIPEERV